LASAWIPARIELIWRSTTGSFEWPQMPDQSGLAALYHVDPRAGKTFVLDASHKVVAAGPMGPEIEKAVRQLLAAP
jgi:hypothetical protein